VTWAPISEFELADVILQAERRMTIEQSDLWDASRITPRKWSEQYFGSEGNGFWVVAVIGKEVVWYNDIEDGFNVSKFSEYGSIDEYLCNQDPLEVTLQRFVSST
jgi:hypothetical protein